MNETIMTEVNTIQCDEKKLQHSAKVTAGGAQQMQVFS